MLLVWNLTFVTATVNILPLSITVSWFEEAFHIVVRVTFAAQLREVR